MDDERKREEDEDNDSVRIDNEDEVIHSSGHG